MKKLVMLLSLFVIGFVGCAKDDKPADPVVTPPVVTPEPPATEEKIVVVYFKFDSVRLTHETKKVLDAAIAEKRPDTKMIIVGYTDSQGSKKYNQKLSEKRAAEVSKYLAKHNVASEASGKGEEGIVNKDLTKADHAANRRAVISFTITVK
jgi:outer membrane protein OmpA-like peptidoglycan-associated protein